MARRKNELFIGREYLNIEGREVKHPALIKVYGTININKISSKPINVIGLDLETNHKTAELKLLGFYNGQKYNYYHNTTWIESLFSIVRYADRQDRSLVYWNRLDPFVLFKQFLYYVTEEERNRALYMFAKISGEWDNKDYVWEVPPVVKVQVGPYTFGIKNVIRSSVQFYFHKEGNPIRTVWAYDVAQLFQEGLEATALGKKDKATGQYLNKRLPYYTKMGPEFHKIDWDRFETDEVFRNGVLYSNELDARAVYDLAYQIQEEFKESFRYYPKTLISQGSLARASIVATICNMYDLDITKEVLDLATLEKVTNDIKSIAFINYYDEWYTKYGGDFLKDLYALSMEAYSGGEIEAYAYGTADKGAIADLTQAYPGWAQKLWDLRNCKITKGTGEPPKTPYSYCLIRGTVKIPSYINYHPLTVKHPIINTTNIRPTGEYIASYILEEREYLIKRGATFTDETWYNIQTEGKLSPLAVVTKSLTELRAKLKPLNKDYTAKITSASIYGLTMEAVNTYELEENDIIRAGYRAGEFFNPIYATWITGQTRIQVSEACDIIKEAGGIPILAMTDSVIWKGTPDMLPAELWRHPKTVGYFEKPSEIKNIVCLGTGRYGYEDEEGKKTAKKRGLNAVDVHDPEGITLEDFMEEDNEGNSKDFDWGNVLDIMTKDNSEEVNIKVRVLVSVGLVNQNSAYTWEDLGKVVTEVRHVPAIVGKTKRVVDEKLEPRRLAKGLVETKPVYLIRGMNGTYELNDQTLPNLRRLMMLKEVVTAKEKRADVEKKASKKYYSSNKGKKNDFRKNNYAQLRAYGYHSKDASLMANWSIEKIQERLKEDGKI